MLPVYYETHLVGHIERAVGGITFAYVPEWLNSRSAFAISLSMPLHDGEYGPGIATPWFANLLPEEAQLEKIGKLLGHSQGDVYGILEEVGRDTAGALSIGAPEAVDNAHYQELNDKQLAEAIERLPQRPLLAGEEGMTMSLAGAQSKLTVAIFGEKIMLPMEGAASTHILKPESERLASSVENELLCMTLASKIKLPVAPVEMRMAAGKKFLLVERYDRKIEAAGKVRRGHQEDFCQALSIYPTDKYEKGQGPRLRDLYGVIDKHVGRPARDRLTMLDFLIYACSIGDTDRHGKNYSLILTDGPVRLAPGYDFMCSLIYDNITRNLAMKIDGKNRADHIERRHWQQFAKEVRLASAATVRRVKQLATSVATEAGAVAADLVGRYPEANRDALTWIAEKIKERAERVAANSQRNTAGEDEQEEQEEHAAGRMEQE